MMPATSRHISIMFFPSPICDPNLHPNSNHSVYTVYTVVIHIQMEGQT